MDGARPHAPHGFVWPLPAPAFPLQVPLRVTGGGAAPRALWLQLSWLRRTDDAEMVGAAPHARGGGGALFFALGAPGPPPRPAAGLYMRPP